MKIGEREADLLHLMGMNVYSSEATNRDIDQNKQTKCAES